MTTHQSDGWRAAEADLIRRARAATVSQRLQWLEEAVRFAARFGALRPKVTECAEESGASTEQVAP